ncbi:MAG: hypothetical protein ACKO14_08425 [Armatimonadota bacterium]
MQTNRYKQTKFAIGYWVEPPFDKAAFRRYREVADCGINLVLSGFGGAPKDKFLPILKRFGLDAILMHPSGSPETWPADKNIIGYGLVDEPSSIRFNELKILADTVRAARPGTIPFVNLFPNYATPTQLGSPDYATHVADFIRVYQPDILCMDNYPIFKPDRDTRALYIDNLAIFRKQSLAAGIPFWNFFNIMPYGPHTDPTEAQVRWQVNASLVYGAKGLLYFCYFTPGGDEFPKGGAIIGQDGLKTHHYGQAQRINKTLRHYGRVLMDCTSTDVAQIMPGDTPSEKLRQSAIRDIKRDRVDPPHDYLVGTFRHTSGRRAVILMNNRFAYSAWPTVEFDVRSGQRVVEIDPQSGREVPVQDASPAMDGVQIPLFDGGARLFLIG